MESGMRTSEISWSRTWSLPIVDIDRYVDTWQRHNQPTYSSVNRYFDRDYHRQFHSQTPWPTILHRPTGHSLRRSWVAIHLLIHYSRVPTVAYAQRQRR